LVFDHGFSEKVLSTLDTIVMLAKSIRRVEEKTLWFNEKRMLIVGRYCEGHRHIPCIKERNIRTLFGFVISREDQLLVLVDNMLHVRDSLVSSRRFPEINRKLRAVFYEKSIAGIARAELAKLARQTNATLEYKDSFNSSGA
jgi:hypothetical protein